MAGVITKGVVLGFLAVLLGAMAPGDELAGNSLEGRRSDGARAAVTFHTDGTVGFAGAMGDDFFNAEGTYVMRDGQLCLTFSGEPEDCWHYPEALVPGVEKTLSSVDGQYTARFVLVEGHDAKIPAADR